MVFAVHGCRMVSQLEARVMEMNAGRQRSEVVALTTRSTWLARATWAALVLLGCGAEGPEPGRVLDSASEDTDGVVSVAADEAPAVAGESVEKAIFTCTDPAACCSRDQMNTVTGDEALAALFLANVVASGPSLELFATPRASQLLATDFGPTTFEDLLFVFDTYGLVEANLSNTEYSCVPEATDFCTRGAQAINVSPGEIEVQLCPLYFEVDSVGRAQTLIHEATHQGRNTPDGLGTDDLGTASIFDASSYARYAPKCTISPGCF
jgi:hypothetical protein